MYITSTIYVSPIESIKSCVLYENSDRDLLSKYSPIPYPCATLQLATRLLNYDLPCRFFEPFIPEMESINCYLERADLYLKASGVVEAKTVPVFLSAIGLSARDLCRPALPETKSYDQLQRLLKESLLPTTLQNFDACQLNVSMVNFSTKHSTKSS